MDIQTFSTWDDQFGGTCLQGYVDASHAELVEKFGEPSNGDGYKTDAEWLLNIDGVTATIYIYKDGVNYNGAEGTPMEQIRDWHVGGNSKHAVEAVRAALRGA